MRMRLGSMVLAMAGVLSGGVLGGQAPSSVTGTWTAVPEAGGTAPVYGQQLVLRDEGQTLEITRVLSGASATIAHALDGSETTSRVPGRLCQPDSGAVWTASRDGAAFVVTMVGALPPGGGGRVAADVKNVLRLDSPDSLIVEVTSQPAGQAAPRVARGTYRRSGPAPAAATPIRKASATLAQLGWIAGTWIGTSGPATIEERWTPPAGGSMQAVSRTLRNGGMAEFEFLCIVERDGGVVYQAMPNGRMPATDFTATSVEPTSVTFENPAHDFPKVVRYSKRADGALEAVISGAAGQGRQSFVFTRRDP